MNWGLAGIINSLGERSVKTSWRTKSKCKEPYLNREAKFAQFECLTKRLVVLILKSWFFPTKNHGRIRGKPILLRKILIRLFSFGFIQFFLDSSDHRLLSIDFRLGGSLGFLVLSNFFCQSFILCLQFGQVSD